ncbi:ABC transporter ATP-binding protein [Dactylosporangium sp. AC04546]|uniref:ABC transporter ATP-binding protein n=1 Tax=Dactylosporangium sp. AC04546 TaxID=2862460 RepID=UPI001EDDE569|nr:ABC transporter ATP-binding protein [Dactylosporangium sp. AC04546]WVK78510.1 ABC transporter ATP-binding protein [Dactylosporangium sp. AC04546]
MAGVALNHVSKVFPGGAVAVDDVTLTVADGEFLVLVGPSGCGKSTILRIVAGLEEETGGTVSIDGTVVTGMPPKQRDIAMVFQNYALYPHMDVAGNLAFALRLRKVPRERRDELVLDTARMLEIGDLLDRKPKALSGGQRQRVAMGRAIVRHPRVFLMDEPLSNLDAKLRVSMRAELRRLHGQQGITTVYVTHDQVEAMTLGDRIAVVDHGRLQQVGTPRQLYREPANVFVAGFIGSPSMNLARARVLRGEPPVLAVGDHRWALPAAQVRRHATLAAAPADVVVGLRPDALRWPAAPGDATLETVVTGVETLGHESHVLFAAPADATAPREPAGDEPADLVPMWSATVRGPNTIRPGDTVVLGVDLDAAYFFDPVSQLALPVAEDVPCAPVAALTT